MQGLKDSSNRRADTVLCALLALPLVASVTLGCERARFEYTLGTDARTALGSAADTTDANDVTNPAQTREAIAKACGSTPHQNLDVHVLFEKPPAGACAWNQDGNLGTRDLYFQARREQVVSFDLPADAVICAVDFEFSPQTFYYDDEFLFTFNSKVLASSFNFENTFDKVGSLLTYQWDKMVGIAWAAFSQTPYCAGRSEGLSSCSFPDTSTNGTIALDYDPSIFQEAYIQSAKTGHHEFSWITTGDNDQMIDCSHEPIDAQAHVSYIR